MYGFVFLGCPMYVFVNSKCPQLCFSVLMLSPHRFFFVCLFGGFFTFKCPYVCFPVFWESSFGMIFDFQVSPGVFLCLYRVAWYVFDS